MIIVTSFSFNYLIKKDQHRKDDGQSIEIKYLLLKANSSLGTSPVLAENFAKEALSRSARKNQAIYVTQASIILGKVKTIQGQKENALVLFRKAQELAQQNSLIKELCEATINIGEIIYDHGNYDSALVYFREAGKIAAANNFKELESYSLYYIGKYNETKGNFDQAKAYYDRALDISRKNKDYRQLVSILPSRGKNYISEGKLNLALECYLEAFHLSEQLNDQLLYAETSSHLGTVYLQMDQYEKALEYDKKALAYRVGMNNPDGLAKSYNNIGKAYIKLNQPDSAFYYFSQSLIQCEKIDYKKGIVKALTNIARIYIQRGNYNKAYDLLSRAFAISTHSGYKIGIAESGLCLANVYQYQQQTDKAIHYYLLSLGHVNATNYDEILRGIYKGLYECYSSVSNTKAALEYHILLLEAEKRLLNVESKRQLALLNISFDLERKEKDNQVLRTDNELKEVMIKRKTTFIWLIVVALGFTLLLCLNIYNRLYAKKKANKVLEALNQKVMTQNKSLALLNTELENVNREKDKLFSIISHELRNPLYWFQNLAEVLSKKYKEMPPDRVQKSLSALDESAKNAFHLMDNLLQWSRSKLNRVHPKKADHNLYELVADTAETFHTILQHKEIQFSNTIPQEMKIFADADLFCCVIRNLISNAIKYTPHEGSISIACTADNNFATIAVKDTGTGINNIDINRVFDDHYESMPGLLQEKGSGLGLKLCRDFVELNGGQIRIKSITNSGTEIFFTVPLMPWEKELLIEAAITNANFF